MENKTDNYVTELESDDDEYETESLEDQAEERELTNIMIDNNSIVSDVKEQTILFNNNLVNFGDISPLKNEYLQRYNYDEIIGLLLNTHDKLLLGASIIIDEIEFKNKTGAKFYNNYDLINEKTASIISIILKCMPIHVEKNNKMFNRFEDEPTAAYLYYIKKILLILKQNVISINFDIIKKLFPKLFCNIYHDSITDEELIENQMMRKLLLKIN